MAGVDAAVGADEAIGGDVVNRVGIVAGDGHSRGDDVGGQV